jgi:uncharacterized protein involved in exopolysaccharide biosynthesis
MSEPSAKSNMPTDEVSLREVVLTFWRGKWLILGMSVGFAAAAGLAALLVPKSFVASSIVVPVTSGSGGGALGGLGSLASQFGGLASLAGVSVPGDSKKFESIAVLQSELITEKYIHDNNLLPIIFSNRWDKELGKWKGTDSNKIPTLWQGNDYFKKRVRAVTNDTKTGLATISITWSDPKIAAAWVNDLIKLTNEYLRAKAIRESEANMAYLNEQILKTDVLAMKQGIYSMLQGEINKAMTAKGTEEFALKIIDPAVAPDRPASPQPVAWILFGFFGGLVLSAIIVYYRNEPR